jgi:phosphatidylinositol glycan class S
MAERLQEKIVAPDGSKPSVDGTAESPSPPPEKANAIWTRRIIIFAFWTVVATLGLPHWIWTTSIYRSELPVEQMTQWAEGHVGVPVPKTVF